MRNFILIFVCLFWMNANPNNALAVTCGKGTHSENEICIPDAAAGDSTATLIAALTAKTVETDAQLCAQAKKETYANIKQIKEDIRTLEKEKNTDQDTIQEKIEQVDTDIVAAETTMKEKIDQVLGLIEEAEGSKSDKLRELQGLLDEKTTELTKIRGSKRTELDRKYSEMANAGYRECHKQATDELIARKKMEGDLSNAANRAQVKGNGADFSGTSEKQTKTALAAKYKACIADADNQLKNWRDGQLETLKDEENAAQSAADKIFKELQEYIAQHYPKMQRLNQQITDAKIQHQKTVENLMKVKQRLEQSLIQQMNEANEQIANKKAELLNRDRRNRNTRSERDAFTQENLADTRRDACCEPGGGPKQKVDAGNICSRRGSPVPAPAVGAEKRPVPPL